MTHPEDVSLHPLDPHRIPVVLLGGINLVRTLGLGGLQAVVATSDPEEPALASRHCTLAVRLPPREPHDARVDALAKLGERLAGFYRRRVPLMVGGDDALELIYQHRDRLERFFLMRLCDSSVADALIAKDRFQALAEQRGLPVPRALDWESTLREHAGPVVVKPRAKRDWQDSALCQRLFNGDGKALVFPTGAAAADHPVVALHCAQLTFQEFIPGDDRDLWSFHGYAGADGELLAAFTGRKIRTYPVGLGESAFIELARDAGLEAAGRDVARRCELRGFFKMDFKRDPRDGRWMLLEINARCTLWNYLGAVNGLNLMRVAYDDLVHAERPLHPEFRTRRRWLWLGLDWRAYREMAGRGELSALRWTLSVLSPRNVHNLFSLADPWPWLGRGLRRAGSRWNRGPGRVMTAIRQWRSTAS